MLHPETYSAPAEVEKAAAKARHQGPVQPNERPRIEADPLTSFENFNSAVRTDLATWMTGTKDARIEKAKAFAAPLTEHFEATFKMTPARRVKTLNYIIWLESVHPNGERDVAAVAFNGLFPKKA